MQSIMNLVDWVGVTIMDQTTVEDKVPKLLDIPGSMRFIVINLDTLVGPVCLSPYLGHNVYECRCGWHETEKNIHIRGYDPDTESPQIAICNSCNERTIIYRGIDMVFFMGKLPKNRPISWVNRIRSQCEKACVPAFDISH